MSILNARSESAHISHLGQSDSDFVILVVVAVCASRRVVNAAPVLPALRRAGELELLRGVL